MPTYSLWSSWSTVCLLVFHSAWFYNKDSVIQFLQLCVFWNQHSLRPLRLWFVCVTDVNRKCWCVTTKGLHAVGQVEVVVLLQCLPEEKCFPKDIFNHFIQLYKDTLTGEQTHRYESQRTPSLCQQSSPPTLIPAPPVYCREGREAPFTVALWHSLPGQRGARRLLVCAIHSPVSSGSTFAEPALPLWSVGPQSRGGVGQSVSLAPHAAARCRV